MFIIVVLLQGYVDALLERAFRLEADTTSLKMHGTMTDLYERPAENPDELKHKIGKMKFIYNTALLRYHTGPLLYYYDTDFHIELTETF